MLKLMPHFAEGVKFLSQFKFKLCALLWNRLCGMYGSQISCTIDEVKMKLYIIIYVSECMLYVMIVCKRWILCLCGFLIKEHELVLSLHIFVLS